MSTPVYVTRPSLPPLEEYLPYLEAIWSSGILTHNGPLVQELESQLCRYLDIDHLLCVANGTCALQLAMRALDVRGEVITTPFTYIATANIISWERCKPVFVDIDPLTWNIDPDAIEAHITPRTSAIMAVHVFSAPCAVKRIEAIARKHDLRVIYDAAHAVAVEFEGRSLLEYGDISCVSFHATKLFNTAEGGACISTDEALVERIRCMRFFGHGEDKTIVDTGMNAKMTEISAALGLANLKYLDAVRRRRREKSELYFNELGDLEMLQFQTFDPMSYNFSYMPVVFSSEKLLQRVLECLEKEKIYPRRYFYPSLNKLSIFDAAVKLPVSERIAGSIACLPLYDTLDEKNIIRICEHIRTACIVHERTS